MDIENITQVVNLVLVVGLISILSAAGMVFGLIKQGKMLKRDVTKADLENEQVELENKQKKLDIAEAMDNLATSAANKAVDAESRLTKLEIAKQVLEETIKQQDKKIIAQAVTIKNNEGLIKTLQERVLRSETRANEADEEIAKLTCEVKLYRGLFAQMKEKGILPEDIAQQISDC